MAKAKYSEKFIKRMEFLMEAIHETSQRKSMGKAWIGEVNINLKIYSHGITSMKCQAIEDIKEPKE